MLNMMISRTLILITAVFTACQRQCFASPTGPTEEISNLEARGAGGEMPRPPFGTSILNSTQLPLLLAGKTTATNDHQSLDTIRNKLALYCFAIDGRVFSVFDQIFDDAAIANYAAPIGLLNGLDNITSTLAASQEIFGPSQHMLGTQFIEIVDLRDAYSVTYYRSIQFGKPGEANEGQAINSFGQYQDTWFRQNPKTQDWKIIRRNLVYMTPFVGNLSAFTA